MNNLDQIRARNALKDATKTFGGEAGGEVVKKVPTMIRDNGLIGAMAFARDKGGDFWELWECIAAHVSTPEVTDLRCGCAEELLKHAVNACASDLRRLTDEALAYLNYLRRFAKKPKREGEQ